MHAHFYTLCREGRLIEIKELVRTPNTYIDASTGFGFMQACANKHVHVIRYLISLYRIYI
jgi:hypothetical protein